MKMDGQIRVKTDSQLDQLYRDLTKNVVNDSHELFFICVCLGYKYSRHKLLGKNGEDRFWSKTITPREWACYYAIVLEEKDMDFEAVQDDKSVIQYIEGYANGGMDVLIENFLEGYLNKSGGKPQLDMTCSDELPKNFLHFIYEEADIEFEGEL